MLEAATVALIIGAIVGGTELVKRIFAKDYEGVAKIVTAVAIGVVAVISVNAVSEIMTLPLAILTGVGLGFTSAGVVTTATRIG